MTEKKSRIGLLCIICWLLLPVLSRPAQAAIPVILDAKTLNGALIGRQVDILEDRDQLFSIQDIVSAQAKFFHPSGADIIAQGFSRSAFWIRIAVTNPSAQTIEWFLENDYPQIDSVDLYTPKSDNTWQVRRASDYFLPFHSKEVPNNSAIFTMSTNPGTALYYMRVAHRGSVEISLHTWSAAALNRFLLTDRMIFGIYYGIILIMFFYNFFIFLSVRNAGYLYYGLNIMVILLAQATLYGHTFEFLWPRRPGLNESLPFLQALASIFGLLFARSFLETKKYMPRMDKGIIAYIGLNAGIAAWSIGAPFGQSIIVLNILLPITCLLAISLGIIMLTKKSRPALFYTVGYSIFLAGIFVKVMGAFAVLPASFFTIWADRMGIVASMMLFSFGLADQINTMKDQLADLNQHLEQKVEARTNELNAAMEELTATMEELEAMNEMLTDKSRELEDANAGLKELDRLKSNFVANISHEIRTPLTLILSPIESYLQGDYKQEPDRNFFLMINKNGIRLLKLINNLLDFSKIDAGRMTLSIKEADIALFLGNYVEIVRPTAESRQLSIGFENMARERMLWFDLEKIDKVIMNLLSNAVKFTPAGGRVMVRLSDTTEAFTIKVEDSGEGIPQNKIDHVFDRFSQVDSSSVRKFEGSGIGLSLARELVHLHKGTIAIASRHREEYLMDHGTTVSVTLRKGTGHFAHMNGTTIFNATEPSESVSDYTAVRFSGMRELGDLRKSPAPLDTGAPDNEPRTERKSHINILIVEDNADMATFIAFLLKDSYSVHSASNGQEGLLAAKRLQPNLIITDVMMPEMDGYAMTQFLKKDEALKHIPVIMLTAKSDISQKIEALEFGADDYLVKPFNSKELLARIRSLLKTYQYQRIISERNREIESELTIGRRVMLKLLPDRHIEHPRFSMQAVYIPCDSLGGDFYDHHIAGDTVNFFIADVSGHGVAAAFFALITKISLVNILPMARSAADVLSRLNEIITEYSVKKYYVTAFYCTIDLNTRMLTYSRAGQYHPLVYRRSIDEFYELKCKGAPLGWFSNVFFEQREFPLEEGDRIVLFTDGIIECREPGGDMFGDSRFRAFIREHIACEPYLFSEKLIRTLKEFCHSEWFEDDVTMIVIDVTEPEAGRVHPH